METRIKSSDMIKNLAAGDRMSKVIVILAAYTTLSEPESYGLTWCDLVTLNVDIYLGESWFRLWAASQHLQPSWLIIDESRWLLAVGNFAGIALEIIDCKVFEKSIFENTATFLRNQWFRGVTKPRL